MTNKIQRIRKITSIACFSILLYLLEQAVPLQTAHIHIDIPPSDILNH